MKKKSKSWENSEADMKMDRESGMKEGSPADMAMDKAMEKSHYKHAIKLGVAMEKTFRIGGKKKK
jgi:hypothetical protein